MNATPNRADERAEEPARAPAGVQVILVNGTGEVLLQLRDATPDIPYPGTWCLPGGHLEPPERPVECAARELAEEMGLTFTPAQLHHARSQQRSYGYEHTYAARLDIDPRAIALTEGQQVRFFSPSQISAMTLGYDDDEVLDDFFRARGPADPWSCRSRPPEGSSARGEPRWNGAATGTSGRRRRRRRSPR